MKFNKKALLILILILPLAACVATPQQPVSSFRPIASPTTQFSLQQSGEWQTEDNVSKSTLTITKISDNLYNFSGKALPKNGDSVYNTSGTISYKGDEAIFMYEKPGSSMIRAKYMSQDNNNTFIYTVTATDNEMVKQGEKYTFKKSK